MAWPSTMQVRPVVLVKEGLIEVMGPRGLCRPLVACALMG